MCSTTVKESTRSCLWALLIGEERRGGDSTHDNITKSKVSEEAIRNMYDMEASQGTV